MNIKLYTSEIKMTTKKNFHLVWHLSLLYTIYICVLSLVRNGTVHILYTESGHNGRSTINIQLGSYLYTSTFGFNVLLTARIPCARFRSRSKAREPWEEPPTQALYPNNTGITQYTGFQSFIYCYLY